MTKGKRNTVLLGVVLLLGFIAFNTSCTQATGAKTTAMQDSIAVVTFETATGGWGYTINVGNRPFIYQDIIPARPGRQPFQTKEEALRVGNVVAGKIRNKELPTLTTQEVAKLGIR